MGEGLFVKKLISNTGGHSFNPVSDHLSALAYIFSIRLQLKIFDNNSLDPLYSLEFIDLTTL